MCNLGSPNQESIVQGKSTILFFSSSFKNAKGIYETNGESTIRISRPIQSIIEAIPSANYSSIAGYGDGDVSFWSIGDVTYDDIAYTNVVIYYRASTKT